MVKTGTRTPEKVDEAKEAPALEAPVIAITIAETNWLQNIYLKEKWKTVQLSNY